MFVCTLYTYVYMYVCGYVFLCVKAGGLHLFLPISLHLVLWDRVSHWTWSEAPAGWPESPQEPSVSGPNTGFINTCCYTPFLPSAGDQNLGPHTCVASVLPHWIISSVLIHVCWPVILLYKVWNLGFSFSFLPSHRDLCSRTYRSASPCLPFQFSQAKSTSRERSFKKKTSLVQLEDTWGSWNVCS